MNEYFDEKRYCVTVACDGTVKELFFKSYVKAIEYMYYNDHGDATRLFLVDMKKAELVRELTLGAQQ